MRQRRVASAQSMEDCRVERGIERRPQGQETRDWGMGSNFVEFMHGPSTCCNAQITEWAHERFTHTSSNRESRGTAPLYKKRRI